jgi:hypothetical protein
MFDDAPEQPCAVCDKPSRTRVHTGCRERIDANLRELPQLYRQLGDALMPGRRGGDGRSATRTAPLPCSIDTLDLLARGGIEGVVGGWARDLCERENWTIPHYGTIASTVDWACGTLGLNLAMICDEHPAVRELADELRSIASQARRIITGEAPPRKVPVACPCGRVLRVTLDTPGERCGCGQQYGRRGGRRDQRIAAHG